MFRRRSAGCNNGEINRFDNLLVWMRVFEMEMRWLLRTAACIPVIDKMRRCNEQAPERHNNSFAPALHKYMADDNHHKSTEQQYHRHYFMMNAYVGRTDGIKADKYGKDDHAPFNQWVSQETQPDQRQYSNQQRHNSTMDCTQYRGRHTCIVQSRRIFHRFHITKIH
jgi:hypothetical protein